MSFLFFIDVHTNGNLDHLSGATEHTIQVRAETAREAVIKAMDSIDKNDIIHYIHVSAPSLPPGENPAE